jgi:hypothetical protein
MYYAQSGSYNVASGNGALGGYLTGNWNVAYGAYSLGTNNDGSNNVAVGGRALTNVDGSGNVGVGFSAGSNLISGSNNIYIGNQGVDGESGIIRVGTSGTHTQVFVAGIYATNVRGSAVMVNSSGQLGVVVSSERFKTDVAPMSDTERLDQLRPVTYRLKSDPKGPKQYGLIAEQVAKVYPELVIRNENGRIDGVRYDELAPMLLNELQRERRQRGREVAELKQQLADMRAAVLELQENERRLVVR